MPKKKIISDKAKEIIERKTKKKNEKQLKAIVVFMMVIIAAILLSYWLAIEMKKFEFAGLTFTKTKSGSTIFYVAKLPLKDIFGEVIYKLPVYIREDPRKLARINITDKIILTKDTTITAAPGSLRCEDSMLATTTLAVFLQKTASNINLAIGTLNKTEAKQEKRKYVTCDSPQGNAVIVFQESNSSTIEKKNDCYILNIANCEIMNVTERFMLGWYAHSNGKKI